MIYLREQDFAELQRCRKSPAHFLHNYGKILDPTVGRIPFSLYDYQKICLDKFVSYPLHLILKSRQMGMSWLVAGFALWMAMFFTDKKILMISIKDETAKGLLAKVYYIWRHLPDFLKVEITEKNMSKIKFCTGSEVKSVPTSEEAGRSESLSLLIIDEAAYIRWMEQIWGAAFPTLSTGGQAIVLSTPNGMGNFYNKLWTDSISAKNFFNPIRLNWWYHPDRNREWYSAQQANMSTLQFAQEVLCDFVASGNLVFDVAALRSLQDYCSMVEPIEMTYTDEVHPREKCGLYYFEKPKANENYILCADTALGGDGDLNAAHILKASTGEQVVEFQTSSPLPVFNQRIYELANEYNYALMAVENNNMGVATHQFLQSKDYPYIYEYQNPLKKGDKGSRSELGFPTNSMTRPLLITELDNSIREDVSGVQGIRTANQLLSFAWGKKGKAEAQPGHHDDLVMSLGIGRYVRAMSSFEIALPMHVS